MQSFLKMFAVVLAVALFGFNPIAIADDHGSTKGVPASEALAKLKDGNERFLSGKFANEHKGLDRVTDTATNGQHPFAVIVACADSRVPAELLFDQGLGDIFVVRVAGNIAGPIEAASVEYGVDHTGANLVVLLGHTHCGAIGASLSAPDDSKNPLIVAIKPTIKKISGSVDTKLLPPELFSRLVEWGNVQAQTEALRKFSPLLKTASEKGRITRHGGEDEQFAIIMAVYDIETGKVQWSPAEVTKSAASASESKKESKTESKHAVNE